MNQQSLLVIPEQSPQPSQRAPYASRAGIAAGLGAGAFSRDEMNLAEFPLAVLSTRVNPKVKTLEFTDTQRLKNGELLERSWTITGADKFGLPTSTDDDVMLGLIRMSLDHGFRERKVYFTRYELLKTLQWTTEGRSYSRLTKSLDRLSGVRIKATNGFYDNHTKSYQTCNFGIIDAYEINDERGKRHASNGETPKSFFIWSEVLFDSFRAGYIKKLDLNLYFSLKSAVSRRLYRYLDKHFYYRTTHEKPLQVLAFEKLGLSRTYRYASSIKQQLEPAFEELISVGFLSKVEYLGRGLESSIRFTKAAAAEERVSIPAKKAGPLEDQDRQSKSEIKLISALVDRGIAPPQARKLIVRCSEAELPHVEQIIRYFDWLVSRNDPKISQSKTGFLYKAVERRFQFKIPSSFRQAETSGGQTRALGRKPDAENRKDLAEYRAYKQEKVEAQRRSMEQEDISSLREQVRERLSRMKSAIGDQRFEQVVESCVNDEIAKLANALDVTSWRRFR